MMILQVNGNAAGRGSVKIDGEEVHNISGVAIHVKANQMSVASLELCAFDSQVNLDGAEVSISGTSWSEAMERALLAYLQAKYEPIIETTSLSDPARNYTKRTDAVGTWHPDGAGNQCPPVRNPTPQAGDLHAVPHDGYVAKL